MSRNRFSYRQINVIYQVKDKMEFPETDEEISSDGSSFKGFSDYDEIEAVADAGFDTIFELSIDKLYRKVCTITASTKNEESECTKQSIQLEQQEQFKFPDLSSDGSSFKGFSDEDEDYDEDENHDEDHDKDKDHYEVEAVADADSDTIFEFPTSKLHRKVCMITASTNNEESEGINQSKQLEQLEQCDLHDLLPITFTPDIDQQNDTSVRPTQNIELFTSDDSQISNDLDKFARLLQPETPIAMVGTGNEPQTRKRQQNKAIKSNYLSQLQTMMQSSKSKEFFDDLGQVMFPKVSVRLKVQQLEILFGVHFVTATVTEYNQLCPNWPPGATLRLVIDAEQAEMIKEGSKFLTQIDLFSPPHIVLDAQKQSVPVYLQPGKISLLGD